MSPAAEKGCPYCHAASGEECKPGCVTGPGVYVAQSADVARGRTETMVPHSVMVSQIEAAVLAERERCARIAEVAAERGQELTGDPAVYDGIRMADQISAQIRSGE